MSGGASTMLTEPSGMRVLGFNEDRIVVHDLERGFIRTLKDGDLKAPTLVALMGLDWLKTQFAGGGAQGFSQLAVIDWLQRLARQRGHFDESCVRGRGASKIAGRVIFHAGDRLIDGRAVRNLGDIEGGVFTRGPRLTGPAEGAATRADGAQILKLANGFGWEDPTSALLLAGWCALAPLCGALPWRPHLWITGGAGSGKTTLLNEFVLPMMNGCVLFVQGDTTEAGLRQKLRDEALAMIMDEGEPSQDRDIGRIQNVLTLLRQSSSETGARTLRGSAGGRAIDFRIRSAACIASIQVSLQNQADLERFCVLELKKSATGPDQELLWRKFLLALRDLPTDTPAKLQRRMLDGWGRFEASLQPFRRACLATFGSARHADQYGVLLAGAWVMVNDGVATDRDVERFMADFDWSRRKPEAENDDAWQAWAALLLAPLWNDGRERSVFDAVKEVVEGLQSGVGLGDPQAEADRQLRNHGLIVRLEPERVLHVARLPKVGVLLKDTPYRTQPARLLERLPGAVRGPGTQTFSGVAARTTVIPLSLIEGLPGPGRRETEKQIPDER